MTDSQTLLAEYATTGSESAFRELVARYVGLVYSTARRLVNGDTHLAEDVAQTVFMDLARKARGLPSSVMLGGWLHQRTFNVAAPMMRAARRRQSREREAVHMNAIQDDPAADLEQIAPMLDEALTKLEKDDRTAIILRFFERRDFRSIGTALGR
jgi:RNA polymerase sigma factor (sigma-70 family)